MLTMGMQKKYIKFKYELIARTINRRNRGDNGLWNASCSKPISQLHAISFISSMTYVKLNCPAKKYIFSTPSAVSNNLRAAETILVASLLLHKPRRSKTFPLTILALRAFCQNCQTIILGHSAQR